MMLNVLLNFTLIYLVSGGDYEYHDYHLYHHQYHQPCSQENLEKCTDALTRALDKHDLGFVTTEMGLNSLCE